MRTDVHNHALPRPAIDLLNSDPVYRVRIENDRWEGGHHPPFTVTPEFYDPEAKLVELESKGLEAAVVSTLPPLFYTDLELEPLEALCAAVNVGLAQFHAAHPERFRWLAHVPLGFPERAAELLAEALGDGAVGVEIPTRVGPRRLDEPDFEPFWAAVEELRVPILMHPFDNEAHRGLDDWYLQNVIGNQLETTIAVERLICAGVLDRHPGLQIVLVHAGGYFPFQAGRLRHARTARAELAEAPADPWAYRGQILVDTITHDRDALAYVVARMGTENVVMGTDLPFDMATPEPMAALEEAVGAETARAIVVDNPARVFARVAAAR
jgi:aminocarboxymuconate-semialdehyde decarboxylase